MHEIAPNVHLHHPAGHRVSLALLPYVPRQPIDAVVCAASSYTAVGVGYKRALKQRVRVVVVEVMHYAVTEVGGEHLPLLRVGDDETRRWARTVAPLQKLVAKHLQVPLPVPLKPLLVRLVPLVPPCVEISLAQVGQKPLPRQAANGIVRQVLRTHRSDRLPVVAVVVVHVLVVRVERRRPVAAASAHARRPFRRPCLAFRASGEGRKKWLILRTHRSAR